MMYVDDDGSVVARRSVPPRQQQQPRRANCEDLSTVTSATFGAPLAVSLQPDAAIVMCPNTKASIKSRGRSR